MNITASKFIHAHPVAFSVLVITVAGGGELLMTSSADLLSIRWSILTIGVVSGAVLTAVGALALTRLGLWRQVGLVGRPQRIASLLWCLPFLILGVLPLTAGPEVTAGEAAAAVAFGVLIAFWKLVVLGLLIFAWLPRGGYSTAVLAAAFWAVMHLVGGILTGAVVAPTVVQALSYLFFSFALAAVWMRTRLLWPLVACYAVLLGSVAAVSHDNGASNLVASVADVLPLLGFSVVLAVYGFAVWPRRRQSTEQENQAWGEDDAADRTMSDNARPHS